MKMKSGLVALAIVSTVACATPAMAATNLVTDGSFEAGFSGWTLGNVGGGTAPVVIAYGSSGGYPTGAYGEPILPDTIGSLSPDPVGGFVAYFSSDTANPDSLTQNVNLVAGQRYNIGFDYYAPQNGINNPNDAQLSFLIGGAPAGATLTAGSASGTPAQRWFNFNTTFLATTTGPTPLTFQFRGTGVTSADFAIDRVYAIGAVPEASTWSMMIAGFAMVGAGLRARKRQSVRITYA